MPQCRTLNVSGNMRCRNSGVWGTYYCYRHYPKNGIIFGLLTGVFIGVAALSLLHFSLDHFLYRLPAFHYLDSTPPQMKTLSPDFRRLKGAAPDLKRFQINAEDTGSGMDWSKTRIHIKRNEGGSTEALPGRILSEKGMLRFEAAQDLKPGNYLIEAVLTDKAGRETPFLNSFTVEAGDLGFRVNRHLFKEDPDPERFRPLLEAARISGEGLWVYKLFIFHQARSEAVLKNLKIQAEFPGPVTGFYEIGSSGTDRVDPFPVQKPGFWKAKIFPDRKWFEIGELDAHGVIGFSVLVQCTAEDAEKHTAIPFSGTYEYQSYQHSGPRTIGIWVPAAEGETA